MKPQVRFIWTHDGTAGAPVPAGPCRKKALYDFKEPGGCESQKS